MSLPYVQQPSLIPAMDVSKQHGRTSSVGPLIAVLAVVMVLGLISVVIGRLCAGRRIPGIGQYDLEGWFGTKFGPCVDGQMGTHVEGGGGGGAPIVIPVEKAQDTK
ncbi:hypothetical protein ZOSMA_99G00610 [Zostera marina]|uniref:Uncharacterized protein n=1 Tax=Zostera marina TaxID=29655 RepID=A0A0K9NJK1_ZOSMR|nr:hypothetical protein ZOSMA_99G00610 [Zostera marina]